MSSEQTVLLCNTLGAGVKEGEANLYVTACYTGMDSHLVVLMPSLTSWLTQKDDGVNCNVPGKSISRGGQEAICSIGRPAKT